MSAIECFTQLFDMMHINRIIPFFYIKKGTHFLKSFYNNLIAKNRFVTECT